jgi:hypothetical protein
MVSPITLDHDAHFSLPRREGLHAVSKSVGARGEILWLCVAEPIVDLVFGRRKDPGGASFARVKTDSTYEALLMVLHGEAVREVHLHGLSATFPMVQLFADGAALLVAPRCECTGGGTGEINARVYDSNGGLEGEFLLGDGIQHVQIDSEDRIWVGYFDEGVYGNFGWGMGDGPAPIGAAGLLCFDRTGKKLWEYESPEGAGPIDDCYALNVSEAGAWAYYYSDFPLVHIDRKTMGVTAWSTPGGGGSAFATDGKRLLLYGGYGREKNPCRLFELHGDAAKLASKVSLTLPKGNGADLRMMGRGDRLYLFAGDDCYTYSVASI